MGSALAVGIPGTHDRLEPPNPASLRTTFPVTFTELGLPSGTNWSVSLNESTRSSVSSAIDFEEPNGTYQLFTWDVRGYISDVNVTTVNVSGAPTDVTVYYNAPAPGNYFVTFVQSGLALNTSWEVQLSAIVNGTTGPGGEYVDDVGPTHTFAAGLDGVENGTFAWTALHLNVPKWPIPTFCPFPSSGTVVINGTSVLVHLAYSYSYPIYFDVEGVAADTPVTLQIPNETATGSGSGGYLLMIPNGTYAWNATAPGYRAENGTVSVEGLPKFNVEQVSFEALPSTTSGLWGWVEIGVVIAVIFVGVAVLLLSRRRGGGQTNEAEPTSAASAPPPSEGPPSLP